MKPDFETVWNRILAFQGEEFRQIRGGTFTYTVEGDYVVPNRTNWRFPKKQIEEAYKLMPVSSTKQLQHLYGPSYLYAILMDGRIRQGDW